MKRQKQKYKMDLSSLLITDEKFIKSINTAKQQMQTNAILLTFEDVFGKDKKSICINVK